MSGVLSVKDGDLHLLIQVKDNNPPASFIVGKMKVDPVSYETGWNMSINNLIGYIMRYLLIALLSFNVFAQQTPNCAFSKKNAVLEYLIKKFLNTLNIFFHLGGLFSNIIFIYMEHLLI